MKRILSYILMLVLPLGVFAQQAKISGQVVDQANGRAISKALVKIGSGEYLTDFDGRFTSTPLAAGTYTITVVATGFDLLTQTVKVELKDVNLTLKVESKSANEIDNRGLSEVSLNTLDNEDNNSSQNVSGLLHSSGDVFTSTAGYTLSSAYFRMRGYDSEENATYMNGVLMNDAENGRPNWSEWSGLNDATRNKDAVNGLNPASFSFGGIGGATNIISRASLQRKQVKVSYALSNRTYANRLMFTYSTGLMQNNWAFSFSASRRWGNEGYIDGTFNDSWAYFFSAEKKINNNHSINFTFLGSPTRRGQRAAATQEVYDLMGDNYYNPNWGYQNGEKRNSRVKDFHEPMAILSHYWKINSKTNLNTNLGYSFGYNGSTALNWYNAADPRPDYYRNLPSYMTTDYSKQLATQAWQTNPAVSQVDWDKMYQINYLSNMSGMSARYIVENRRNDQQQFSLTSILDHRLNENTKLSGGVELRKYTGHHFKEIDDLLGANYWLDVDQFAERDFNGDTVKLQNDLNNPNRKVKEGDKFGYDYYTHLQSASAWAQAEFSYNKLDAFVAGQLSATSFWREGMMKNGRYPDESFGDSEKKSFLNGGIKAGATYKITGRHFIVANAAYTTRAPFAINSFISPRVKSEYVKDLTSEKILSGELSYIIRTPRVKGRLTVYHTYFWDQVELRSFYHDEKQTFVNQVMSGIDKVHQGMELGTEVAVTQTISVTAVAALGNFRYTSRPTATISFENGASSDTTETIYCKNFYVSGTPQAAGSLGINYRSSNYWFFNANLNYFGKIYLDFNPERRTEGAITNLGPGDPLINTITEQVKMDDGFTLDASIGKNLRFGKYYLNVNLSVSNILDNTELVTGGFEQLRFDFENKNIDKFPPKYFYGFGRTYFLNIGFRF